MPLSWNEIKQRAIAFARDWKGTTSEKSERQTFWNEFFEVFGKRRRSLATFEEPVKKLSGNWGFIDLFDLASKTRTTGWVLIERGFEV